MRTLPSAIALSLYIGVLVHAQAGVDFSGRWVLESTPSTDTPTALTVRQSLTTTNVRGEPMQPWFSHIAIEREVGGRRRTEEHRIGILGGMVGGLPVDASTTSNYREHHSVTWDAHDLVFQHGSHTGPRPETGVWTERRERWSLDANGLLHVAITTRGSGEPRMTVTAVYRRQ